MVRILFCFVMLAVGLACGSAFLITGERSPSTPIIIQDRPLASFAPAEPVGAPQSLAFEQAVAEATRDEVDAPSGATPSQSAADPLLDDPRKLTVALQKELARVGCYQGTVHGAWDLRTKTCLLYTSD